MDDKKRTPEEVEQAKAVFFEEFTRTQDCFGTEEGKANLRFMLGEALDHLKAPPKA
jgi:hypothetical protein